MTTDFNLTIEPWIPVTWRPGCHGQPQVGLREAFARSHEIFDLAGRPHERVALLRLLQCVAQAAFRDTPNQEPSLANFTSWRALAANDHQPLRGAGVAYLDQHRDAFALFHPDRPFLQLAGLTPAPKKKTKKRKPAEPTEGDDEEEVNAEKRAELLDLCVARDNTSTLFDQTAGCGQDGGVGRTLPPAKLALALLCYLNFAPGQPEGAASVNKTPTCSTGGKAAKDGKCYASDTPCLTAAAIQAAIHTFALGGSLAESVHLNLVPASETNRYGFTAQQIGSPIWELPTNRLQDQNAAADLATDENLRPGFLEWLVPMSRFARLNPDCERVVLTNGVGYSPYLLRPDGKGKDIGVRLPSMALAQVNDSKGQTRDVFVAAESGKALWRQLHLLTFLSQAERGRAPAWLRNVDELTARDAENSAWRVRLLAVAALREKKAKFEAFVESVFEFRAGLLWRATAFKDYSAGVQWADELEGRLEKAVATYANELVKLGANDLARNLKRAAKQAFWSRLDQESPRLLALLDTGQTDFGKPDNPWGQAVRDAARAGFRLACPALTAPQLLAHAAGLAKLFPKPKRPKSSKS